MSVLLVAPMQIGAKTGYTTPVHIDSQQAQSSGGTSRPVNVPTGIGAGDFVYALVWSGNASDVWSPPVSPGTWTLVASTTGTSTSVALYKKIATASEGSTYTFTGTQNTNYRIFVAAYRGASTISVNNLASMTIGSADPQVASSISATINRILVAVVMINNSSVTLTSGPSGMTSRLNGFTSTAPRGAAYDLVNPSTGASGTKSFDISSALFGGAFLFEIQ